jgi:hypothetical protein
MNIKAVFAFENGPNPAWGLKKDRDVSPVFEASIQT